jgi:hypothetical protein
VLNSTVALKKRELQLCCSFFLSRIYTPMTSVKYITKQLLLLEAQLFKEEPKCRKCVQRRFLLIESLMDGVLKSDNDSIRFHKVIRPMIDQLRKLQRKYPKLKTSDVQKLRTMRKQLMKNTFHLPYSDVPDLSRRLAEDINHKCADGLLPILDPMFNVREVVKNILLLEDHLLDQRRRCMQCLKKHLLLIEAFLEEAITLSKKGRYVEEISSDVRLVRSLQALLLEGRHNYYSIAIELKKMRERYFDRAFNFVNKCCT